MSELVCVEDYQRIAESKLTKYVREYFNSGANYQQTYKDNTEAFKRYRFRPKYMRDVSKRNTQTTILGQSVQCPIGVSPMAMCRLAHPDGEVAIAQACSELGRIFTLSTTATAGLEEIAEQAPNCPRWFQIHILTSRKLLLQLIRKAELNGFTALALTVDCSVHGRRYAEMRNNFTLPAHLKLGVFEDTFDGMKDEEREKGWAHYVNNLFSSSATWDEVRWLKTVTKLPIVVKGVVTGEAAREALASGADAIWVSNHGGRELDCVPATIDALEEVARAVGDRCEIYLDGGVRSGLDVLKALAFGARAVFVGRPLLWGIAVQGRGGAVRVLQLLEEELCTGMALCGSVNMSAKSGDAMAQLVCVEDFQKRAETILHNHVLGFFNQGANYEHTVQDNIHAFNRYRFRPKYMRDVSKRNTQTTILGQSVQCPIGVSPMAMCRLAHPDGEVAIAQACSNLGRIFTMSTTATASLGEIQEEAPDCPRWFQVHILTDRELLVKLVQQAELRGFTAVALTVDCNVHGRRFAEMRNKFVIPEPFKMGVLEGALTRNGENEKERWGNFINNLFSPSATWDDVRWLKTVTKLPIVVKGVLTGDTAREAMAAGADAIWVSNHGGRELDGVPASIDALEEVARAVGDRCEVYLDGGVRSGLDVLKALALGARAVFVGRPLLWGLAVQGREGAEKVLQILQEELSTGMALSGASTIDEITRDLVVHESFYKAKM